MSSSSTCKKTTALSWCAVMILPFVNNSSSTLLVQATLTTKEYHARAGERAIDRLNAALSHAENSPQSNAQGQEQQHEQQQSQQGPLDSGLSQSGPGPESATAVEIEDDDFYSIVHDQFFTDPLAFISRKYRQWRQKKHKKDVEYVESYHNSAHNSSLSHVLLPGMAPENFKVDEHIYVFTDLISSPTAQGALEYDHTGFYDVPMFCKMPHTTEGAASKSDPMAIFRRKHTEHRTMGYRLWGHTAVHEKVAPYQSIRVLENKGCTPVCRVNLNRDKLQALRRMVEQQARVHLTLDQLPVLTYGVDNNRASGVASTGEGGAIGGGGGGGGSAGNTGGGGGSKGATAGRSPVGAVRGYPVGIQAGPNVEHVTEGELYLHNHLRFIIYYRRHKSKRRQGSPETGKRDSSYIRITGFQVKPVSITHQLPVDGSVVTEHSVLSTCSKDILVESNPMDFLSLAVPNSETDEVSVIYSYEVDWVRSDITWADRWDVYLLMQSTEHNGRLPVFSILTSLSVIVCLSVAVAAIFVQTLRSDIARYNGLPIDRVDCGDALAKVKLPLFVEKFANSPYCRLSNGSADAGWKMVRNDVFRPPTWTPSGLAVLVGTGCQLGLSALLLIFAILLGLVHPSKKGHGVIAAVVLYILSGVVAGFVSHRLMNRFEPSNDSIPSLLDILEVMDAQWFEGAVVTATALPSVVFGVFAILNFSLWLSGAHASVSLLTTMILFAFWTLVSTPMVVVGSYISLRYFRETLPVSSGDNNQHTSSASTRSKASPLWSDPRLMVWIGGLLPFFSVYLELYGILSALWLHHFYYFVGLLLLVMGLLAVTCAETSLVFVYWQLQAENHRWWWPSFWHTATAGLYLMIYSARFFYSSRMDLVGALPVMVYISYSLMMSVCFGIFCGSVGFISSYLFIQHIYSAVKLD